MANLVNMFLPLNMLNRVFVYLLKYHFKGQGSHYNPNVSDLKISRQHAKTESNVGENIIFHVLRIELPQTS